MPELHDLLERRASRHEPPPDLFDRVLDRRRQRDRNRRIGSAVVVLVVAAVAIGGLARAFLGGAETRPADQGLSAFQGEWVSVDYNAYLGSDNGSHQTMTIRAAEDGAVHVRAYADESAGVCWDRRPGQNPRYVHYGRTLTGIGRLEDPATLVVPSPAVACTDGDRHTDGASRYEEADSYRLVLDPATGRLYDNLGVIWNRGAPPDHWSNPSTESGVEGPGTFAMLHGEVTFRATAPWTDHIEAYMDPRLFFLVGTTSGEEHAYIEILVNGLPPDTPCDTLRTLPSAQELVEAIRSNPDLETTAPVTEPVGGVDALRMDVRAVPGAPGACGGDRVGVVLVPGRGSWGGIDRGAVGRLYVLDLPGGSARTLAIWIAAPDAASFEQALETAAPVVDSFEFHTG